MTIGAPARTAAIDSGPQSAATGDLFTRGSLSDEMRLATSEAVVLPPRTDGSDGSFLFELDAVPAKEILRNKAAVCPPTAAFCEILDNVFDNAAENGRLASLRVVIQLPTEGSDRLSIVENSGGVTREKLAPLVRLGVPHHRAERTIGSWGEGLKIALFSLGRSVDIITRTADGAPLRIAYPEGWLDSASWLVPVYRGPEATPEATTQFVISQLTRPIDGAALSKEFGLIYGHKITEIRSSGGDVEIRVRIDGVDIIVEPRVLASDAVLISRFAFPPLFQPRAFETRWVGENGTVQASIVAGMTARHSGETSGVYLFGNGRLFARALRTRVVGYGESGSSIIRDHPSCWRIHAYVFIDAQDSRDIPWQAPLKDGISENHPATGRIRSALKAVLGPYSRFARIARASEVLPYTVEWNELDDEQRTEALFGDHGSAANERLKRLPPAFRSFKRPKAIERVNLDAAHAGALLDQLDLQAREVRRIVTQRDVEGQMSVEDSLALLNPEAFGKKRREPAASPGVARQKRHRITLALGERKLRKLREIFHVDNDLQAITAALLFAIRNHAVDRKRRKR